MARSRVILRKLIRGFVEATSPDVILLETTVDSVLLESGDKVIIE